MKIYEASFKKRTKRTRRTYKCFSMAHKMILDPDADGSQWIYRDCFICDQTHPYLLKYACYDESYKLIDVTSRRDSARKIIDDYKDKGQRNYM